MEIDTEALMTTISAYAAEYGLNILAAILILIFGRWVCGILTKILRKTLRRAKVEETLVVFAGNITYGILMALVVIAAIAKLGVETTSIAAVFAAAGLAVGLALQGSLSNFAAGVLLIVFRPFRNGDFVEIAGTSGKVDEISIFTTRLITPDNKNIIIPNSTITAANIINYSAEETRRVDLTFGIGYGDDIRKAKQVLETQVNAESRYLEDPAPVIAVAELGDSSVNIICRGWVKTADYWDVYFAMLENVKLAFDKEGISIPFPQRDVHLYQVPAVEAA
ncbi:MAG: mechanosensitive ion channel [Hyphomicrobiales bacterium]|nr:mechanosensitive ion channel [Rickettsiales bacterium]MCP5361189.1 mechanosensitive ion channel [Hyphomicrobiales bacterium]